MALPEDQYNPEKAVKEKLTSYMGGLDRLNYSKPSYEEIRARLVDVDPPAPHHVDMAGPTREEINARLEAAEARVAWAVESMRAEVKTGVADIKTLGVEMKAQADKAQATADRFYADAGKVLAEIKLQGEVNRTQIMSMGYKFAAWFLGALVGLASLYFTVKKATQPEPAPTVQVVKGEGVVPFEVPTLKPVPVDPPSKPTIESPKQ
ncbi:hypothetical protein J2X02_003383 [Pseudoxanthomonas japonensis]|uniref:hypothetical protein n=1 Tax=Pseudoxanthomonas japonensis TaxID=69284 RepID=UPI00285DD55F|nr:hypothetical protein [Pseudoxanthomonas japonensis]MDR7070518.1 hypothetical protein [Pseudoxanthomonas japonensis]